MRFYRIGALVVAAAISWTPVDAGYHHVIIPVVKATSSHAVVGGGGAASGASVGVAVVGGGLVVLTAAIVWCANNQPKRNMRRDIWVDGRHDVYPTHNSRAEGCVVKGQEKRKRDPNPISVRR